MANNTINYQSIYSTQIHLNSYNADIFMNKTKKSNVVFFFNDTNQASKNVIEMRISVVNAQIPVSWYLINDSNNCITITLSGIDTTFYIPVGNYNVNTFITQWYITMGQTWLITFDNKTNKFTFSNTLGQFTFSDGLNSIYEIIGFIKGNAYTTSGNYLTSMHSVNFGGLSRINIESSTFNIKNVDSYSKGITNTLVAIPVNCSQSGFIYYNNFTNFKAVFKTFALSSINIEIMDDKNNYIDFNNLDWTMTLQIDMVHEIVENFDTLDDVYKNQPQEF